MKKNHKDSGLVYSTEQGRTCPECGKASHKCICKKKKPPAESDGIVRISLDRKGRKGKGVSVITGLPLDERDLKQLAKKLKTRCGSGGTVKLGVVEIQGDHRSLLMEELKKQGYQVKLAGG